MHLVIQNNISANIAINHKDSMEWSPSFIVMDVLKDLIMTIIVNHVKYAMSI